MRDRLVNVEQAREMLGDVSRSYVYKLCNEGVLRTIVMGKVKGLRIYSSSLEKFIASRKRGRAA